MESCVFCKMVRGDIKPEIIWQNDLYFAFLDQNPVNPGHTLLIPKKHSDYIFDLSDDEYVKLMLEVKKLAPRLQKAFQSKRVGLVVEGFGVSHVHVHLVPINNPHELDSKNAKHATEDELKEIAGIILKNQ